MPATFVPALVHMAKGSGLMTIANGETLKSHHFEFWFDSRGTARL